MQYIPKLTSKEIEQNHRHFSERAAVYKKRGLDFLRSRELILEKAGALDEDILEIGSGTGYTALSLAKAGYRFISIDPDEEALRTTALNLAYEGLLSSVKLQLMDGTSLAFANNSFKSIVIVNLLHHITNADKMFSETDRVLGKSGKVILADFNKKGMEIVGSVHKQEGRMHEDSGVGKKYAYSYFHGLGYEINSCEDKCHWALIGEKKILQ